MIMILVMIIISKEDDDHDFDNDCDYPVRALRTDADAEMVQPISRQYYLS